MITDVIIGAVDSMIDLCSDTNQALGMASIREMLCDIEEDNWISLSEKERIEWLSSFLSCSPKY